MQKLFSSLALGLFLYLASCNSTKEKGIVSPGTQEDETHIFPVTSFLKGQLREIDSMPVSPLRIITANGKKDSTWLNRKDIRIYAAPFLVPEIDSATMSPYFSEKSFLDQTINEFTFSYDPKVKLPDTLDITHWDVYINPQKTTVSRVYVVKERKENNINYTTQLTWVANEWYSIRTITQKPGKEPEIKEEKMIWDFD
ncbi:MAG: hypothetical protein ABI237_09090 [Ginsengibacter sp.]